MAQAILSVILLTKQYNPVISRGKLGGLKYYYKHLVNAKISAIMYLKYEVGGIANGRQKASRKKSCSGKKTSPQEEVGYPPESA